MIYRYHFNHIYQKHSAINYFFLFHKLQSKTCIPISKRNKINMGYACVASRALHHLYINHRRIDLDWAKDNMRLYAYTLILVLPHNSSPFTPNKSSIAVVYRSSSSTRKNQFSPFYNAISRGHLLLWHVRYKTKKRKEKKSSSVHNIDDRYRVYKSLCTRKYKIGQKSIFIQRY